MLALAQHIVQMPRSGIREIMDLASTLPGVIHLEVGEPSFETPAHIVEAACEAARQGYTKYTPNTGLLSLREKLVGKLQRVNGVSVSPENVVVTAGAVCGLATSLMAVVEPGDEVLIPDPGWPNYESMVAITHGVLRRYSLRPAEGFLPNQATVEEGISSRTKAIVINSPSNPTGAVFPREVMGWLVRLAQKHGIFLVSDEVYEDVVFDGEHVSALSFGDGGDRVIGVFGFSKSYAMTGWRLGYVVASREIAAAVGKLQEPLVSCASAVSQKAAEAALDGPQDCVAQMREAYRRRRDLAAGLLMQHGVDFLLPSGTFYLMVDISRSGVDSYTFAKTLLKETGVAVAPGATFGPGARDYVRLSLATSDEQLAEGINRLAVFLAA